MRTIKFFAPLLGGLLLSFAASAQNADSLADKISTYAYSVDYFAKNLPQEKVYLHLDNTSYYHGDNIWFKAYIVSPEFNRSTKLSKTLYVELLNPGGEVIDHQILKIENGQCHGDFKLNHLPFYSGYYEVRAYTKYMLNFGPEVVFSRVIPVFDKPKVEGNFVEKSMLNYGMGNYPNEREKPIKEKSINVKFFPEGGNMVLGVESRVAFQATDEYGSPINVRGAIVDRDKRELVHFESNHEGRGVFRFTPSADKMKVVVERGSRDYQFDLLVKPLAEGFVLGVDNLTQADSIGIEIRRGVNTAPRLLGLAVMGRERVYQFCLVQADENPMIRFKVDKTKLSPGVCRIVLFDDRGEIIGDRLIFSRKGDVLKIKPKISKLTYEPFERVEVELAVTTSDDKAINVPFSLSVRDGAQEVFCGNNILSDLLLMSEIRGYVSNPSYYFQDDDKIRRRALDELLMVQGWRRYSWNHMAGKEPFDLRHLPEKGVNVQGQVVSFVKGVPKPNVELSAMLIQKSEQRDSAGYMTHLFITDSMGRFAFTADVKGEWDMMVAATVGGRKKDYRVVFDRLFSPPAGRYEYFKMQAPLVSEIARLDLMGQPSDSSKLLQEDDKLWFERYTDSLAKAGVHDKMHYIEMVEVSANRRSREMDIYMNRSQSVAHYDVSSLMDNIKDRGEFVGESVTEFLLLTNKNFRRIPGGSESLLYKGRKPLFVINYGQTMDTELFDNHYQTLRVDAIKAIYVNETMSAIIQYADPKLSPMEATSKYNCVVFIETYPEGKVPTNTSRGVRRTSIEGYSTLSEFYSPDYSVIIPQADYRRTLYWNPSVMPDADGRARVVFYNNGRKGTLKVDAQTITRQGMIGVCVE